MSPCFICALPRARVFWFLFCKKAHTCLPRVWLNVADDAVASRIGICAVYVRGSGPLDVGKQRAPRPCAAHVAGPRRRSTRSGAPRSRAINHTRQKAGAAPAASGAPLACPSQANRLDFIGKTVRSRQAGGGAHWNISGETGNAGIHRALCTGPHRRGTLLARCRTRPPPMPPQPLQPPCWPDQASAMGFAGFASIRCGAS